MIGRWANLFWRIVILIVAGIIVVSSAAKIPSTYSYDPATSDLTVDRLQSARPASGRYVRLDLSGVTSVISCHDARYGEGDSALRMDTRFAVPLSAEQRAVRNGGQAVAAGVVLASP